MSVPKVGIGLDNAPAARQGRPAGLLFGTYACFFLSGAASLVFEVLWSRQFVTVFGNSAYAVSVVLCAYMTGLGLGGLAGGKIADRIRRQMTAFGAVQMAVAGWALLIPLLLEWLRILAPTLAALSPESLVVSTLTRFGLSFAVLVAPCFLMGMTLPLLARAVTDSDQLIGARIGALYCWNALGAAFGVVAAGFWMLETLGVRLTNLWAAGVDILTGIAALALSRFLSRANEAPKPAAAQTKRRPGPTPGKQAPVLLTSVAFVNGLASLTCEVLWFRYLAFLILQRPAYVFATVLCIYLIGLGLGGLIYSSLAKRASLSMRALGVIELLLAISVIATFATGAWIFAGGPPRPVDLTGLALITVLLPTVLMGMAFPLLCRLHGREVANLGRQVGLLFAVNTAGTAVGSLLPVFVLAPLLGIQRSLLLASLLCAGMGLALLARDESSNRKFFGRMAAIYAVAVILFLTVVPSNLCQRVFLASSFNLARHTDIVFYREGRTGTAIVTRDKVNHSKAVYVNAIAEVPLLYGDELCFKMLGDLGPLLHPHRDNVLMICLGGGVAAGATTRLPEVKSLTVVDLESSVEEAASHLATENNAVLQNAKTHVVIDDGRNYVLTARRRWPVIITDSTHPKTPDSWVLYTREFYQLIRDHLTEDGVFVQWAPMHGLSIDEYKIILRTFQAVFPHASLWVTGGMEDQGQYAAYSLLLASPKPLSIDAGQLQDRLDADSVRQDLEPYGLHTAAGFLDAFVCAEDTLRQWTGPGPINTDDLPLTYYNTRYSKPSGSPVAGFCIEPMEDIWPRLTNTGADEEAARLHHELMQRARANELEFAGQFEEACNMLPEDIRYRRMRSLYEEGPRYTDALLKTYWDNAPALVFLATMRLSAPDGPQAVRPIYERVLALDSNNVSALSILGGIHSDAGDTETAENYLRQAVRLDPKSGAAQYNLALLLDRTGRHAEARPHYEQAAKISDDARSPDVWGVCLAQEGRLGEAVPWFRRGVEIGPTEIPPRLHLAYALDNLGHTQEALAQARLLVKLEPQNETFSKLLAELEARCTASRSQ